jgi:LAO/AO transport system kinase
MTTCAEDMPGTPLPSAAPPAPPERLTETLRVLPPVVPPAAPAAAGTPRPRVRRLSVEDYVEGVRRGDRTILARAITLIESSAPAHQTLAQAVLRQLLPHTGKARRIGITGAPGVGKSTFIEAFGCYLCRQGLHVAVLAVDPSSNRAGGSILGDKTRMEQLCRQPNAFIRPSPSGKTLGGVARKTRETMLLCEAAGFDVVLVETVGVGQSEVAVRSMVDFFLLLLLPGAGDELQGIKKGIVENADAVLVTKADGPLRQRAEQTRQEYATALHYLAPATPPWKTPVAACSALTGEGIPAVWDMIQNFYALLEPAGILRQLRQEQSRQWLADLIREELEARFYRLPGMAAARARLEAALLRGEITAPQAAQELLALAEAPAGRSPAPSSPSH